MADMIGYVYKTTNLVNGKVYIGQHQREAFDPLYYGSGKVIMAALKKYGRGSFTVEVLSWESTVERLDEAERYFIAAFDARNPQRGYNLSHGGHTGWMKGLRHSEEAKRRIGAASVGNKYRLGKPAWNRGIPMPGDQRQAQSERQKGKPLPAGALERARQVNLGRKLTEEHKRKISESSKGKPGTRNGAKHTAEARKRISESNKGKHSVPMPETAKAKLREYWSGKPWSAERRAAYERSKLRLVG